jgi:GxxExxY protein
MARFYEDESYTFLGACFEVCREVGWGFLEDGHQEGLPIEFEMQGIPSIGKPKLELFYKGRRLAQWHQPDLVCCAKIVVEWKAVSQLTDVFRALLQNDLRSTRRKLGFLVNFAHHPQLEYEQIVL